MSQSWVSEARAPILSVRPRNVGADAESRTGWEFLAAMKRRAIAIKPQNRSRFQVEEPPPVVTP